MKVIVEANVFYDVPPDRAGVVPVGPRLTLYCHTKLPGIPEPGHYLAIINERFRIRAIDWHPDSPPHIVLEDIDTHIMAADREASDVQWLLELGFRIVSSLGFDKVET